MSLKRILLPLGSHAAVAIVGFAGGIYVLPILVGPPAPTEAEIKAAAANTMFIGTFRNDLKDSDELHGCEGTVSMSDNFIWTRAGSRQILTTSSISHRKSTKQKRALIDIGQT